MQDRLLTWSAHVWQVCEPLVAEAALTAAEEHLWVLLCGHTLLPGVEKENREELQHLSF